MAGLFRVGNLVYVIQNGDAPFVPENMVFEIMAFSKSALGLLAEVSDAGVKSGPKRLTFWVFTSRLRRVEKNEWDKETI